MIPFVRRLIPLYIKNGYSQARAWDTIKAKYDVAGISRRAFVRNWREIKQTYTRNAALRAVGMFTPPKKKDIPVTFDKPEDIPVPPEPLLGREPEPWEEEESVYEYLIKGERFYDHLGTWNPVAITFVTKGRKSALEVYKEYFDLRNEERIFSGLEPYRWEPEFYRIWVEDITEYGKE